MNHEVEEDELMMRYGSTSATKDDERTECDIQIFRPDVSEIVARYAPSSFKSEPDPDDEIILNHPDDDDVVRRYVRIQLMVKYNLP